MSEKRQISIDEFYDKMQSSARLIKSLGDAIISQPRYKPQTKTMRLTKSLDLNETGKTTAVISDIQHDRYGDILSPSGCDLTNYKGNPLFLWEHALKRPIEQSILGKALSITQHSNRIEATFCYNLDDPFAAHIYGLERKGLLPAFSVGWRPLDDIFENEFGGVTVGKWELIETSKVAQPVNARALKI